MTNVNVPPIELLKKVRHVVQTQHDDFSKHGIHSCRIALRGIGEGLDEVIAVMEGAAVQTGQPNEVTCLAPSATSSEIRLPLY